MPPVVRSLPTPEAQELLALTRDLVEREVAPRAADGEARSEFPRELFRTLGKAGLMGLPYDEAVGGGGQPYEVYLQVLEELSRGWLAVGLGTSVHTLACYPLAAFGTDEQRERWLPDMLGGELLGAYCLSEAGSGSDAAALHDPGGARRRQLGGRRRQGLGDPRRRGRLLRPDGPYWRAGRQGHLVPAGGGVHARSVAAAPRSARWACARARRRRCCSSRRASRPTGCWGSTGQGFRIAMSALDGGRLGIAACAVGVAQAALDTAVAYAAERRQFGRRIADFQGLSFLLADMATQVEAARALYLSTARRRDAGQPFGPQAAMSKLFATDTAMRVATDAVQVLGGYGYVEDFPAERYLREAKILQIVEGTNQVQRVVIGRSLTP